MKQRKALKISNFKCNIIGLIGSLFGSLALLFGDIVKNIVFKLKDKKIVFFAHPIFQAILIFIFNTKIAKIKEVKTLKNIMRIMQKFIYFLNDSVTFIARISGVF